MQISYEMVSNAHVRQLAVSKYKKESPCNLLKAMGIDNVVLKPLYQPSVFLSSPTSPSPMTLFGETGSGTSFLIRLRWSLQTDIAFSLLTCKVSLPAKELKNEYSFWTASDLYLLSAKKLSLKCWVKK